MAALPPSVSAHASAAALADALGRYVAAAVAAALQRHGRFVVALSGGSLPKTLAQALQAAARAGLALHTERWHVFYADERCVPLADPDSNHAACKAAVFDQPWFACPAAQLHPIDPALAPAACAAEYAAQIRGVLGGGEGLPQFDLVLLGMGPDGHTASLFPGALSRGARTSQGVRLSCAPRVRAAGATLRPALHAHARPASSLRARRPPAAGRGCSHRRRDHRQPEAPAAAGHPDAARHQPRHAGEPRAAVSSCDERGERRAVGVRAHHRVRVGDALAARGRAPPPSVSGKQWRGGCASPPTTSAGHPGRS